jgi:DHA1 family multidrug resistance protein-like MFS transporter
MSTPFLSSQWKRTLYIMFIAQAITSVGFSSMFPFLPLYVKDLGAITHLSVEFLAGAVFSAQAFSMMIASPIWGAIADRYGRKLMVERSLFGGAVILLLMAFVRSAEELVLLRTIQGLITGTVAAANALVASIAPRKQIGFAMGLLQVGLGAGVALGPLIGGMIADAYGYSTTFYVTAALLFSAGLLVLFGVKETFIPSEGEKARQTGYLQKWAHILTSPGVMPTFSLRFMSQLGRMMIVPIAPLFIATLLIDTTYLNTFTGLVIGLSSAATTISAVYLGRLGDRVGHRKVVISSALIAAVLYLLQSLVTAGWQLLLLQALVGVAMGGIIPAISALLANYTHSGEAGAVYGLDNSINAGGRSVAPMLGSAVAVWFNLRATFSATAVLFLFTALLAIAILPQLQRVQSTATDQPSEVTGLERRDV